MDLYSLEDNDIILSGKTIDFRQNNKMLHRMCLKNAHFHSKLFYFYRHECLYLRNIEDPSDIISCIIEGPLVVIHRFTQNNHKFLIIAGELNILVFEYTEFYHQIAEILIELLESQELSHVLFLSPEDRNFILPLYMSDGNLQFKQMGEYNFFDDYLDGHLHFPTDREIIENKKMIKKFLNYTIKDLEESKDFYQDIENNEMTYSTFRSLVVESAALFFIERHKFPSSELIPEHFFSPVLFAYSKYANIPHQHFPFVKQIYVKPKIIEYSLDEFGELKYLAKSKNIAIKMVLHKETGDILVLKDYGHRNKASIKKYERELEIYKKTNSESIARCYGYIPKKNILVLHYYANGSLKDLLTKEEKNEKIITAKFKNRVAILVLRGIDHLHAIGVIHRDIKSQNILLDNSFNCVISDFESSKMDNFGKKTQDKGTLCYMSPEQIKNEKIDFKTDLYSYGILLYELAYYHLPYENFSHSEIISHISQGITPVFSFSQGNIAHLYTYLTDPNNKSRLNSTSMLNIMYRRRCFFVTDIFNANQSLKEIDESKILTSQCIGKSCNPKERIDSLNLRNSNETDPNILFQLSKEHFVSNTDWMDQLIPKKLDEEINGQNIRYIKMAANRNHPQACYNWAMICYNKAVQMTNMYFSSPNTQHFELGKYYFKYEEYLGKSAHLGNINAILHYTSQIKKFNPEKAFIFANLILKYCQKALYVILQCIGEMKTSQVHKKALEIAFDNLNNSYALYYIGKCYLNGKVLCKNIREAVYYLEAASQYGNNKSLQLLYKIYKNGKVVQQDYHKAYLCLVHSYEICNDDKQSLKYSLCLIYGVGIKPCYFIGSETLKRMYSRSGKPEFEFYYYATRGDAFDITMKVLQNENNKITRINMFSKVKLSAKYGNRIALFVLASCYLHGIGCHKDEKKCFKYMLQSAKKYYFYAEIFVAEEYLKGKIVGRSYQNALKYYLSAANQLKKDKSQIRIDENFPSVQEIANAMINVSSIYMNFFGDFDSARKYLVKAAALDSHEAYQLLYEYFINNALDDMVINLTILKKQKKYKRAVLNSPWEFHMNSIFPLFLLRFIDFEYGNSRFSML